jgi:hypothetical protein
LDHTGRNSFYTVIKVEPKRRDSFVDACAGSARRCGADPGGSNLVMLLGSEQPMTVKKVFPESFQL